MRPMSVKDDSEVMTTLRAPVELEITVGADDSDNRSEEQRWLWSMAGWTSEEDLLTDGIDDEPVLIELTDETIVVLTPLTTPC